MEAQINVSIKTEGNKKYDISLGIPSGDINDTNPCNFFVQESNGDVLSELLNVAVGAKTDKQHFYVNVAPPKSILPADTIENLSIMLEEGKYDPTKKQFTTNKQTTHNKQTNNVIANSGDDPIK